MSRNLFLLSLALSFAVLIYADVIPPEANQLFPQYVGALSYPVETHYIQTADGYINTYFRIQSKNSQIQPGLPVIYLQHGLESSGDDWIINNESQAPAFVLANAGYDIWVGNSRGNRYSLGHIQYNSSDKNGTYWDFTWQNMSYYDLPAAFEYISNQTGQLINYVGHSQGTVIMFAALSRRDPTILKYMRTYCALGPVAYVNHANSPLVTYAGNFDLGYYLYVLGDKRLGFMTEDEREALELLCTYDQAPCIDDIHLLLDFNTTVDDTTRLPIYAGHEPDGTSIWNMWYWNQMFKNNNFQEYDYGTEGNLEHYGQATAPLINLTNINIPVNLFAGIYDRLADPTDVERLVSELTGSPNVTYKTYPYGHGTFMIGKNEDYLNDVLAVIQGQGINEISV